MNIGPRSTPNGAGEYDALAQAAVKTVGDAKFFAGQRDDPFFVDLGSIFDLGGLRPFNPARLIMLAAMERCRWSRGLNTHSIAIEVPTTANRLGRQQHPWRLREREPQVGADPEEGRLVEGGGHVAAGLPSREPPRQRGDHPLGQKDYWNAADPKDDAQFVNRYTSPELASLDQSSHPPPTNNVQPTGRNDLVAVLLTGIDRSRHSA